MIVPGVHRDDDPALLKWWRRQAAKGATIVGVCDGVWVLANAGLLKGHRAMRATGFRSTSSRRVSRTPNGCATGAISAMGGSSRPPA